MGLFSHEYKVHTQTETGMVITPDQVGNTLNGAVVQSVKLKSDLAYILKDKAFNSAANIFNKAAKYSQEGGKYADILGTPKGSFIAKPITKELMSSVLGFEPDKILLTRLQKADEYLYACYIYDTLVSQYHFTGDLEANTGQVKIGERYYTYEGVNASYNEFTHEIAGYYWEYSETQTRYTNQGPMDTVIRHRVPIELDLQPNVEYLIVKYEHEGIHYYLWNTAQNSPLSKWYEDGQVAYYPSFYVRNNNNSIKRDNPEYYDLASQIFNRAHLEFEDIVDSYNAETEVNEESEEDKEYKNSLNDIEDIVITFAVDPTANDQRVMQYLFEFFSVMNNGLNNNSVSYECNGFSYTLRWDSITKETKTGKIAPFHRYISETTQISTPYQFNGITLYKSNQTLRIAHQLDHDTYEELLIVNLEEDHNNNGQTDSYALPEFHNLKRGKDYSEEEHQEMEEESSKVLVPLIPWIVQSKFGAIRGGDLLALGLAYVMHVYRKTKKKWYATKWFAIVRIIVSTIIIISTAGSATPGVIAANMAIQVAILILICIAVKIALKLIIRVFHIDPMIAGIFQAVMDFVCSVAVPGYALANGIAGLAIDAATNNVTLNSIADTLSGIAGSQIMQLHGLYAIAGAAFKLGMDVGFYDALHNKNYAMAITKVALVAMEAGMNYSDTEINSKSDDKSDSNKDSKSDNADSKSSKPTEEPSFAEKLGFRLPEGIGNIATAAINAKAQQKQEELSRLKSQATTLAGQMQASENYWADVLSPNNIIMQQMIIESMQRPEWYRPVRFRHINDYAGEYGISI